MLIVDDEIAVGSTLRLVLQGEHDVHVATSALDALQLMSQVEFDAVVCDVAMPGMTGIELYDAVRQSQPGREARMIFMTGGTLIPQSQEFLSRLENPLLEKPFDTEALRSSLRRLDAPSAQRRLAHRVDRQRVAILHEHWPIEREAAHCEVD
ncbi:MAG: response regulator [Polyangiaceae bacterium]